MGRPDNPSSVNDTDLRQEDLSKVLRNLMKGGGGTKKSRTARRRLANDKLTRAYLEAGMQLIAEQLKIEQTQAEVERTDEEILPFFQWLARQKVLDETDWRDKSVKPSEGAFRHRWEFQADYIGDLLAYALSVERWTGHTSFAKDSLEILTSNSDFVKVVHEVAYRDICSLVENPAHQITILASVAATRDPQAREIIGETYRFINKAWEQLYEATLSVRGLKLRKGISMREFGDMLAALADGISVRQLADPNVNFIDHERRESLLGKAALAVAAACIDIGDGMTLEEVVNLMANASAGRDGDG